MSSVPTRHLIRIEDPHDPRLEDYREIRERDLLGESGRPGIFIAESVLPVEKMLSIPGLTRSILITPNWIPRLGPLAGEDVDVFVAPFEIMRSIAGYTFHRGVLAIGHRPPVAHRTLDAAVPRRPGPLTVLIAEDINNIDNIGLIFRNAAAFAVDAVVLSPRCHDPLYRKSVRVSIGHVLNMPWARSDAWSEDLDRLRTDWELTLIGAAIGPESQTIDSIERPERVAVLIGQEYRGLSPEAQARCDFLARIPMAPGVDSLNVSVAAAVCLHRFSRGERV